MSTKTMNLHPDSANLIRQKIKTALIILQHKSVNYTHIHLTCINGSTENGDLYVGGPLVKVKDYKYLMIYELTEEMKNKLGGEPVELLEKAHPNNYGFPPHTEITYIEFEWVKQGKD